MGRLAGIARRQAKRVPMELLDSAVIDIASGVANDFRGRPGKRQVTLISATDWQAACSEIGRDLPWTTRRSNLLVEDFELPKETGRLIGIGSVTLRTTMEVDPCSRMEEQAPGLKKALQPDWRGGVACTVVTGGEVAVGDAVQLLE